MFLGHVLHVLEKERKKNEHLERMWTSHPEPMVKKNRNW